MTLKRVFLVTMLCLLAFVGLPGGMPKPALACSGGGYINFIDRYKDNDIFVKGTVVEVDDLGQNAIVKVERYYKGGAGPEYVLLQRVPVNIIIEKGRGSDGCIPLESALRPGDPLYFMGKRAYNGAYKSGSSLGVSEIFVYRNPKDKAYVIRDGQQGIEYNLLTEAEFQSYFKREIGSKFTVPNPQLPRPRYAPLFIVTKNEKRYILPVDTDKLLDVDEYLKPFPEENYPYNYTIRDEFNLMGRGKDRCIGTKCKAKSPDDTNRTSGGNDFYERCGDYVSYDAAVFSRVGTFAIWNSGEIL